MDPFIGEIRIFAGNFAPYGWAKCEGQLLPLQQNYALFAVIGTTYGGDGVNNFALPDLCGRVPMHPGMGPGLSPRSLGQAVGAAAVSIGLNHLPPHTHGPVKALGTPGIADSPAGRVLAGGGSYAPTADTTAAPTTEASGQSQPLSVMQPYLALNFIIAVDGVFPPPP